MSKILIVEDEVAIAELEKDYLELSGFDVVMQHTGDAGLKAALSYSHRHQDPDHGFCQCPPSWQIP